MTPMYCNWKVYFSNSYFVTDCGCEVARDAIINTDTCICGRKIRKFVQCRTGNLIELTNNNKKMQNAM